MDNTSRPCGLFFSSPKKLASHRNRGASASNQFGPTTPDQDHPIVYIVLSVTNYNEGITPPQQSSPDALGIQITLQRQFCNGQTLQGYITQDLGVDAMTALQPQALVAGLPAFRRLVQPHTGRQPITGIQVLVPHGVWLYRFFATPANSNQIAAFDRLLSTFKTQ